MGLWGKVKKAAKKVYKKVKNTVKKVTKTLKDIALKIFGILDFAISFIGIRPKKYMRLKFFVLSNQKGQVLDLSRVQAILDMTIKIFKDKCNIEVQRATRYDDFIQVIETEAPDYALRTDCSFGSAFSDAADYYEDQSKYSISSATSYLLDVVGYGDPLFCFVIENISGSSVGCSYPLMHNYILIDPSSGSTTVAHEVGHLSWLHHTSGSKNLMNSNRDLDTEYDLSRYQISQIRTSRHVVYIPRW